MHNPKPLLIAIDGPSSSGKGTIAKKIAAHFNLPCLNTGALYRAIAFLSVQENLDFDKDEEKIIPLCDKIYAMDLESPNLHNEEIGKAASIIAQNQNIRKAIFEFQRNFALSGIKTNNGAVLEGRDIGTVICPDATYKFFIIADVEIRAKRRFKQLHDTKKEVDYETILDQLKKRDEQDRTRASSPLKKSDDAIEIDTSNLNIEETFNEFLKYIKK